MSDAENELNRVSGQNDGSLVPLGYLGKGSLTELNAAGYSQGADDQVHLREVWRMVCRRKWLVVTIVLVMTLTVALMMFQVKSSYQAIATIEVEKDNPMLVKAGEMIIQGDDLDLKTGLFVLQSRPLLEDVVVNLKLDENPAFIELSKRKSLSERLGEIGNQPLKKPDAATLYAFAISATGTDGESLRSAEERARLAPYVKVLLENLAVDQLKDTRILVVSFVNTDPTLAAAVANGVARNFIERSFRDKIAKFSSTSAWLDRSTRALKAQAEQAEQALATYSRQHNIFAPEGKENLTGEKLAHLHDKVMRAETDRIIKQSLYEEVKEGHVARLPEAFTDAKTIELQKKADELAIKTAELGINYGPKHPRMMEVQQQMAAIQEQISANNHTLEEKLRADYERAVRDETSLKTALDEAKAEAVEQNQTAIQYNILKQDVETAKSLYTDFLQKTSKANIQVAEQHRNVSMVEPASVPTSPIGPKRFRSIALTFILSLAASIGLIFLLDHLDNTIKNVADISRYVQLPSLGVIPTIAPKRVRWFPAQWSNGPQVGHSPSSVQTTRHQRAQLAPLPETSAFSSVIEAYRMLRTSVLLSTTDRPPKTILITSSESGEGKTTTAVNMAISLARLGGSVLILDADLRRPGVHKVFGIDHQHGLSTYLSHQVDIEELIQVTGTPNLSVLPSSPLLSNSAELIGSEKMKELLKLLAERYDYILIDSPPVSSVTDPVILSRLVDGVILVIRGSKSKRDVVRHARQELGSVGAKIFGVVLNNVDLRHDGESKYYHHRCYSYGQGNNGTLAG